MLLRGQARQPYFNANGKRANAIRARTTPSLEETKSENMQKLNQADHLDKTLPTPAAATVMINTCSEINP